MVLSHRIMCLLLVVGITQVRAQSKLDSLIEQFNSTSNLEQKADLCRDVYMQLIFTNADSALYYSELSTRLAAEANYDYGIANGKMYSGIVYVNTARYEKAIVNFEEAASINEKIENWKGLSSCYGNLGNAYQLIGKYVEAIGVYTKALKIADKLDSKRAKTNTLNNIGAVYKDMGNFEEALKHYRLSRDLELQLGDSAGLASSNLNIGIVYMQRGMLDVADSIYQVSYGINRRIGYKQGEADALGEMAILASKREQHEQAIEHSLRSIEIKESLQDVYGLAVSYVNISDAYSRTGNHTKAFEYSRKAIELADYMDSPKMIASAYEAYADASWNVNDFKAAAEYYKKFADLKIELLGEENSEQIAKMNAQYENEKKANQISLQQAEIARGEEEVKRQNLQKIAFATGFGLMLILAVIVFRNYKRKKHDHEIISLQKMEVEEKNREILDSITYAKRLQDAILPPRKLVREYLADSFIMYKPKDIVAGDFYWMENSGNFILYAVADCTGHGVPGAMVSVVCSNALNRCVKELGLTDPGAILNKTRDFVVERFERSEEEVKDGMDIALCVLDLEKMEVHYSGANNPLYHVKRIDDKVQDRDIQNGEYYISEVKGDKQPIGKFMEEDPFTTHLIQLEPGDVLYTFSDGFADQFGGTNGKKYKYKPFKKLLLEIKDKPMNEQNSILDEAFEEWRGSHEQLDDVCVIGVRV